MKRPTQFPSFAYGAILHSLLNLVEGLKLTAKNTDRPCLLAYLDGKNQTEL
jgi:hypothetical protein